MLWLTTSVGRVHLMPVWCSQNPDGFHHFRAAPTASNDAKGFLQSWGQPKNIRRMGKLGKNIVQYLKFATLLEPDTGKFKSRAF